QVLSKTQLSVNYSRGMSIITLVSGRQIFVQLWDTWVLHANCVTSYCAPSKGSKHLIPSLLQDENMPSLCGQPLGISCVNMSRSWHSPECIRIPQQSWLHKSYCVSISLNHTRGRPSLLMRRSFWTQPRAS